MDKVNCSFCATPIGKSWLGKSGGFKYADETHICIECHRTAVKSQAVVNQLWRFVGQRCHALGVAVPYATVPVKLLPRNALVVGAKAAVGIARMQQRGNIYTAKIDIAYGMPSLMAVKVLAHEIAHVYCHREGILFEPASTEEGFCNVLAHMVLKTLPEGLGANDYIAVMLNNPDPIYGFHYRQELRKVNALTWNKYLAAVVCSARKVSKNYD